MTLESLISKLKDGGKNILLAEFAGIKLKSAGDDWNPKENGSDLLKVVIAIVASGSSEFCIGKNQSMILMVDDKGNHMRSTTHVKNGETFNLIYDACVDHVLKTIPDVQTLQRMLSGVHTKSALGLKKVDLYFDKKIALDFMDKRFYDMTGHLCEIDKDDNIQFMILADEKADNYHELTNKPFNHGSHNKKPFQYQVSDKAEYDAIKELAGKDVNTELSIPASIAVRHKNFHGFMSVRITKVFFTTDTALHPVVNIEIEPVKNKFSAYTENGQLQTKFD